MYHTTRSQKNCWKLEAARSHIRSLPTMKPHYTRSNTSRKFHECDVNITKMYELYVDDCKNKGQQYVICRIYTTEHFVKNLICRFIDQRKIDVKSMKMRRTLRNSLWKRNTDSILFAKMRQGKRRTEKLWLDRKVPQHTA